jgi:hypothetical protein
MTTVFSDRPLYLFLLFTVGLRVRIGMSSSVTRYSFENYGAINISCGSAEPLIRTTAPDPAPTQTYVVFSSKKYLFILLNKYKKCNLKIYLFSHSSATMTCFLKSLIKW